MTAMPPFAIVWDFERISPFFAIAFALLAIYLLLPRPRPLPPMLGAAAVAASVLVAAAGMLRLGRR